MMMMMPGLLLLVAIFVGVSLLVSATKATRQEAKRKRDYDPDDYNADLPSFLAQEPKRDDDYFMTDDGEFFEDVDDE